MLSSRKSKVLALSLAQVISTIISLISGIIFTRTLSVNDYATYLQTFLAYDFAVPLLTLGLPSVLYYFLPKANGNERGIVLDNLLLLFAMGLIFSFFLALGGTSLLSKRFNNPNLEQTLTWMVAYPLYTFPVILGPILVIKDKIQLNTLYNVLTGLILTTSLIIACFWGHNYIYPILVRIIFPSILFPVTIYLSFKYLEPHWVKPNLKNMWTMLKFGVPFGLASVLGTLTMQLGNLIVSLLSTPEQFAIYSTGAKEVPVIGIITGSIAVVIMAEMAEKCHKRDMDAALQLFRKASTYSATILFPTMLFLLLYANSFIQLLFSQKYEASTIPFRIFLLSLPIRIVFYGAAFIALGKTKLVLYRSFGDLTINLILCYLFVKLIGPNGAAISTILTLYIWSVPYNLFTLAKSFNCRISYIIPFDRLRWIALVSVASGILSSIFLILDISHFQKFFLGGVIFFISYSILSLRFIPEYKEIASPFLKKLSL